MASFTWSQLIIGNILSGVIAALVGAASAYFFQRKLYRRNAQRELVTSTCVSIDLCADKVVEYWSSDTTNGNRDEKQVLARDIHHLLNVCSSNITLIKQWKLVQDHQGLDVMFHELYARSTGGDFEGAGQKKNTQIVARVRSVSGRLTNHLIQLSIS